MIEPQLPSLGGPAVCDECGHSVRDVTRLGHFDLCRECLRRRENAKTQIAAKASGSAGTHSHDKDRAPREGDPTPADPEDLHVADTLELVDDLFAKTQTTNRPDDDDPFDLLEEAPY